MKRICRLWLLALCASVLVACSERGDSTETPPAKPTTPSQLWMPVFLSDGMVVQQNSVATYWGKTNAGAEVWAEATWLEEKTTTTADAEGRWRLDIPTPAASKKAYRVVIRDSHHGAKAINDVLIGEVWHFAGQSNMEMPMRGFGSVAGGNYQPVANADNEIAATINMPYFRYFKVGYQASSTPMEDVRDNKWWRASLSDQAKEFSAIAFFCGRRLAAELDVPVGIICTPYGGTRIEAWLPTECFAVFSPSDYKEASELDESAAKKSAPALLYNGMVHPIEPYTVRGWAWYQGESNIDNAHAYARLQQSMVDAWRKAKGDFVAQLPFYYLQISGFSTKTDDSRAKMVEAQWNALSLIPNSDIVTTSDVGDQKLIHYPNKKVPGERLANLMLYKTYGQQQINPYGPKVESVRYEGSKAMIRLSNAKGLKTTEQPIPHMQLAGSNGVFYSATATILSDGVIEVTAPQVAVPKAVRYCFTSWHRSTLFNDAGVPLAPFRTDSY
ncbi:MAG: hypothetical protein J6R73_00760 [Alistipes sp.]|nr:hypothetical protein [Alistipes sp.]